MKLGYFLSCEEWGPADLVAQAVKAREAEFDSLWILEMLEEAIHVNQIGPFQDAFFTAYRKRVLPQLR